MKFDLFYENLKLDEFSSTPKYLQLIQEITLLLEKEILKKGDFLPSINELSAYLEISRDTVEKSYKYLKTSNIITSVPGKGYLITEHVKTDRNKILLVFNKLSSHKKLIYDSFITHIDNKDSVDFYIYNNDFNLFKKFSQEAKDKYTHYVIIPHFFEKNNELVALLNNLPTGKLILLDKDVKGLSRNYSAVFEDFENDIYHALMEALPYVKKYQHLKLAFPDYSYFPEEIIHGFIRFCKENKFTYSIANNIEKETVLLGDLFILLMDEDLVSFLQKIKSDNLILGKDIGLISYNETPLKKIIMNGIATISTDFVELGRVCAKLVADKEEKHITVPFYFNYRPSL